MAGGFTEFASRSKITVLRNDGHLSRRLPFNYDKVGEGSQPNVNVRPGDVVLVP